MASKPEADKPEAGRPAALAPGLYVTATPIGNAADISARALEVLAGVDVIACEDTRVSAPLLKRYGIATPLTPYHDHNAARVRPRLLRRLQDGGRVALISDAGTPLVSDPGYRLVREAGAGGIAVFAIPGPCAAIAALMVAGLPTDRFLFAGFLPSRAAARRRALTELAGQSSTLVFYESARRLAASLADMAAALGPREAVVARELTKRHEELRRGPLDVLAAAYTDQPAPKGEVVIVVGPPPLRAVAGDDEVDRALVAALANLSVREAVAAVTYITGRPRREIYARALALADKEPKS